MPQIVPALLIGWLFFIVPTLQNNSSTTMNAIGLFPAAMFLLAIVFMIGVVLTVLRIYYRISFKDKNYTKKRSELL